MKETKALKIFSIVAAALIVILTIVCTIFAAVNVHAAETSNPNLLSNGDFATNDMQGNNWDLQNYKTRPFINNWEIYIPAGDNYSYPFTITWETGQLNITTDAEAQGLPNSVGISQQFTITETGNHTLSICTSVSWFFGSVMITPAEGQLFTYTYQLEYEKNVDGQYIYTKTIDFTVTGKLNMYILCYTSGQTTNSLTGVKLEKGTESTAPDGMGNGGSGGNSDYDQGYDDGYQAGLQQALSGVFSGTEVTNVTLFAEPDWQIPEVSKHVLYITNGFSLQPVQSAVYNELQDKTPKQYSVTVTFNPLKWYTGMIYININTPMTIQATDINDKTYNLTISTVQSQYGYVLEYTGNSTGMIINSLQITMLNIEDVPIITAPQSGMYSQGYEDGFNTGKEEGYYNGHEAGYSEGQADGLTEGYNQGYAQATADNTSLVGYILSVAEVPIDVIQSWLDFEILGVNMKNFVLSIFTACLVVVVLKIFV